MSSSFHAFVDKGCIVIPEESFQTNRFNNLEWKYILPKTEQHLANELNSYYTKDQRILLFWCSIGPKS